MNIKVTILLLCLSVSAFGQRYNTMVVAPVEQDAGGGGGSWTNLDLWLELQTNTEDSHGSDDATAYGATVSGDTAYYFDGTDDSIDIVDINFGTDDFTVIMQVYPTEATGVLFGTTTGDGAELYMHSSNRLRLKNGNGDGTSVAVLALTQDQWNTVSVTWDYSETTARFGVDGSYESETNGPAYFSGPTTAIGVGTNSDDFAGYIRRFVVFSDIKTDSYITAFGDDTEYADGDPL